MSSNNVGMSAIQIRDVPAEDREALAAAAKSRNMSLQKYLAEEIHQLAAKERNRIAVEELRHIDRTNGLSAAELDDLRDMTRAEHAEHVVRKTGLER